MYYRMRTTSGSLFFGISSKSHALPIPLLLSRSPSLIQSWRFQVSGAVFLARPMVGCFRPVSDSLIPDVNSQMHKLSLFLGEIRISPLAYQAKVNCSAITYCSETTSSQITGPLRPMEICVGANPPILATAIHIREEGRLALIPPRETSEVKENDESPCRLSPSQEDAAETPHLPLRCSPWIRNLDSIHMLRSCRAR